MQIGQAIKICRERKGISRSRLSEITNFSPSYLSLIENNKRELSISKLNKIADALEIPTSVLVFLASDKSEFESINSELAEKFSLLALKLMEKSRDSEAEVFT